MSKKDYYVIAYRILAYLYECVKTGKKVSLEYLTAETFSIDESYFDYILRNLFKEGYIAGIIFVPILGNELQGIKITQKIEITPQGIEFLQSNSMMNKAHEVLKTLKEIIPGI